MTTSRREAVRRLLQAAGSLAIATPARSLAADPIKIGFITPLSGPYAQTGRDIVNGLQLYMEEIKYEGAGRPLEVLIEDYEAIPAVGLTKTRKLVEKDGVHLMAGALLSSTGYALKPYLEARGMPMLYPILSADDITQRQRSRWITRTGWAASQPNHAFGEYAYNTLGLRRVATIALDYAFGWECVGGFHRTFHESGGRIVQKNWFPVTGHDFAPYLAQISRDVDAVYALFLGRSTLQFMRQYAEFGLKDRLPLIGIGTTTDEHALPFMGDEAIGAITVLHYSAALDNPANRAFVRAFKARAKKIPGYYAEAAYTGAKWMVKAFENLNGHVEDPAAVAKALREVKMDGLPRGPMHLDAYGSPVQDVYVRKVERVNGALQNTVVHTFPQVSQFWKYNPADYLAQPLYTRSYTPQSS